MLDGLIQYSLALVPLAGPDVQLRDDLGLHSAQAPLQKVGKEVMIAVPLVLVIQGNEKEVGAFEVLQDRCAWRRMTNNGRPRFERFLNCRSSFLQDRVAQ
jgi:hypothetical protein